MIISSLRLDTRHERITRALHDVVAMHNLVVQAVAGLPGDGPRVLWAQPRRDVLVIRAPAPIPAGRLPAGAATVMSHRAWETPPAGPARGVLVINPSKSNATPLDSAGRRPEGHRIALPGHQAWTEWIHRRLAAAMTVDEVHVDGSDVARGQHRSGARISHLRARISIAGTVVDAAALADLASGGIGHGKAYGCGLSVWGPA